MFLFHIKLANSNFSPCKFFFFILIQTFSKVLILVPIVSLSQLSDDVDNGEPRHPVHVTA